MDGCAGGDPGSTGRRRRSGLESSIIAGPDDPTTDRSRARGGKHLAEDSRSGTNAPERKRSCLSIRIAARPRSSRFVGPAPLHGAAIRATPRTARNRRRRIRGAREGAAQCPDAKATRSAWRSRPPRACPLPQPVGSLPSDRICDGGPCDPMTRRSSAERTDASSPSPPRRPAGCQRPRGPGVRSRDGRSRPSCHRRSGSGGS